MSQHIYRDGTAHAWPDGRRPPDGWELREGPVPGPPPPAPPTKEERVVARLRDELPALVFAVRDDASGFARLQARAKEIEAEEASR
jgi:hypothetical protein